MRRRSFVTVAVSGCIAALSGCLGGSNPLEDWDFEDREAEAWSYYETNEPVIEAPDDHSAEQIETAIDELGEARELYDALAEEARDRSDEEFELYMEVNDFFLAMHGLVTASRNGLMPFVDQEPPGGGEPGPFFESAEQHYRDAREIYNDADELQDAIDGERFE